MMTDLALTRLVRPNGKPYVARKPPRVVRNVYCDHDGEMYVMVLRTHDVEQAILLAGSHRVIAGSQRLTWERLAMRWGELRWTTDNVRGMPCVVFVEDEESYG